MKKKLEQEIDKVEANGDAVQKNISVISDERGIVIRILDEAFFDTGKADLKQGAKKTLDRIAPVISAVSNPVRVEGHTDNIPISTGGIQVKLGTLGTAGNGSDTLSYRKA